LCLSNKDSRTKQHLQLREGAEEPTGTEDRSSCLPILNLVQRAESSGETEEEEDQDANHSALSLQASEEGEAGSRREETRPAVPTSAHHERRELVKWPKAADKKAWKEFDEDVDKTLEVTLAGSVDKKIQGMMTIIYNMSEERF